MFSIDDTTESSFDNLVKYLELIKAPEIPVKMVDPIDRDWEPNDQVAYPWYAPAGFNRGLVTNAEIDYYI